jgi:hypothetical protein
MYRPFADQRPDPEAGLSVVAPDPQMKGMSLRVRDDRDHGFQMIVIIHSRAA